MFFYISARLEWKMAVGALAAVAHDILLTIDDNISDNTRDSSNGQKPKTKKSGTPSTKAKGKGSQMRFNRKANEQAKERKK